MGEGMNQTSSVSPVGRERRHVERIVFDEPLGGSVNSGPVRIVDLSVRGAQCVQLFPFTPGELIRVTFLWKEERFSLSSRVMHCEIKSETDHGPNVFQAGLRFTSQLEVKASGLLNALADSVARIHHLGGTSSWSQAGSMS